MLKKVKLILAGLVIVSCQESPTSSNDIEELPVQTESEHFVYHYKMGDVVDTRWQEEYYHWLISELEVQPAEKLHYFKYTDRRHLESWTGQSTNGFADSKKWRFHTIWPTDYHECVHVVVFNTIGRACALFDEGIAVAHQTDPSGGNPIPVWSGQSVHARARAFREVDQIPPLTSLLESASFRQFDANVTYPVAGSFVRFLIDTAGLQAMKSFIAISGPGDRARTIEVKFQTVYGETIEQTWSKWLQFLDKK